MTGGIVVSARRDGLFEEVSRIQQNGGAVPSPFDCWLVLRGIRTLPYRMRAHSQNAAKVASFLDVHPKYSRCAIRDWKAIPDTKSPASRWTCSEACFLSES